ncbi:GNAT family N-acetyltransferase [Aeromonas hydrophila]|nr:GNAT family N-acetyltransferase [Aeromonas hydrophila]
MTKMTDPHDGLVSFQEALNAGEIKPRPCEKHKDLTLLLDDANGTSRLTYSLIGDDGSVKALAMYCPIDPINGVMCFGIGYAVAEQYRKQGLSYEIVEKSIDELVLGFGRHMPHLYIEAVIGVDNQASQKVAAKYLCNVPARIIDEVSGLPALQYVSYRKC